MENQDENVNSQNTFYSDEELEGDIPLQGDASYFEKAQNFNLLIKLLRIKYLGLRDRKVKLEDGTIITQWERIPGKVTGINEKGVEAAVRFLEPRLGQHVVLSNISEERMYIILNGDMRSWFDVMVMNLDEYEMSIPTMMELAQITVDLLEFAFRRAVGDKERNQMTPLTSELKRIIGLGGGETQIPKTIPNMPFQQPQDPRNQY